jgi:hypothetical protein
VQRFGSQPEEEVEEEEERSASRPLTAKRLLRAMPRSAQEKVVDE